MKNLRWTFASLITAALGVGVAYSLTLVLISPAHSQTKAETPSDGSLPSEFVQQMEKPAGGDPNLPLPDAPAKSAQKPSQPSTTTPPPPLTKQPQAPAQAQAPTQAQEPQAPPPAANQFVPPPAPTSGTALGNEEYVYDPAGRRDPFKPYKVIRSQAPVVKGPGKPDDLLEPLQRFDVDQLTVLAILWDVKQPRALVRDADGKVHTLVKNTKVGRNNGYVAAIREGEIVVMESFDEEGGKTVKRSRTLEFNKKKD